MIRARSKSRGRNGAQQQQVPRMSGPGNIPTDYLSLTCRIPDPYLRDQIEFLFNDMQSKNERLEKQIVEMTTQLDSISKQLEARTTTLTNANQLLQTNQEGFKKRNETITMLKKEKEDLIIKIGESKIREDVVTGRNNQLMMEMELVGSRYGIMEREMAKLKKENEDMKMFNRGFNDKDAVIDKLNKTLQTKERQLSNLENERVPYLQGRVNKLLIELAQKNRKSDEILKQLEKQKEDQKKELEKELVDKREKLEQANTKITDLLIKLERQRNGNRSPSGGQWKEEMEEKDRIIKQCENWIAELKKKSDSQDIKYNRMIHGNSSQEDKMLEFQRKIEENEATISRLKSQLANTDVECLICYDVKPGEKRTNNCRKCKVKVHSSCLAIWHEESGGKCPILCEN